MNFVGILYHLCHNEDDNFILFYIENCDRSRILFRINAGLESLSGSKFRNTWLLKYGLLKYTDMYIIYK